MNLQFEIVFGFVIENFLNVCGVPLRRNRIPKYHLAFTFAFLLQCTSLFVHIFLLKLFHARRLAAIAKINALDSAEKFLFFLISFFRRNLTSVEDRVLKRQLLWRSFGYLCIGEQAFHGDDEAFACWHRYPQALPGYFLCPLFCVCFYGAMLDQRCSVRNFVEVRIWRQTTVMLSLRMCLIFGEEAIA